MDSPLLSADLGAMSASLPASSSLVHVAAISRAVGAPGNLMYLCTLHNGVSVRVRPIQNDDVQRLRTFHLGLSPETRFLRFAHLLGEFPDELISRLSCVDRDERMAFVATDAAREPDKPAEPDEPIYEQIIGVARYDRVRQQVAEIAAVVADRWQGYGLGLILMYHLAMYARQHGYTTFISTMSRWNDRAIRALMHCGLPYSLKQLDEETLSAAVDLTQLDCVGGAVGTCEREAVI
jgi:GNAT superfamily N-acetyltransferase